MCRFLLFSCTNSLFNICLLLKLKTVRCNFYADSRGSEIPQRAAENVIAARGNCSIWVLTNKSFVVINFLGHNRRQLLNYALIISGYIAYLSVIYLCLKVVCGNLCFANKNYGRVLCVIFY
jgi:hypothetical protein